MSDELSMIEDAIDAGVEAASKFVSWLPAGKNAWATKEYRIAEIAAREAIAALRQMEAGK